ncbi:GFA family protein [Phaeovibrio sulfidiphilus]|uniref:GFA family protein n=1 Tax=Phaeovibrio sulfidiphilus TaxID=1220600 RepID=A0A8J6YUQ9_9PROT|nr:GFA family protein [Phaeovibrio sulfidiphilus]MBE1236117.1 GFA family protein [Phaeovibrio sulfidiphilus]
MLTGRCLCGAVRYEVAKPIDSLVFCHCSRCRKESGSAFDSIAVLDGGDFRLEEDSAAPHAYEAAGGTRYSCAECSTTVYSIKDRLPGKALVRAGTLDQDPGPVTRTHIFVGSKASWDRIPDDETQFDEWPT